MLFPKNILICICAIGLFFQSQISQAQCNPDTIAPVIMAPLDITVSCQLASNNDIEDPVVLTALFGPATATDNCELLSLTETNPVHDITSFTCSEGGLTRYWTAEDASGNLSQASQHIYFALETSKILRIPSDTYPGMPLDTFETVQSGCSMINNLSWDDTIYSFECNGQPDEFERKFTHIDWCLISNLPPPPIELPRLDIDGDGVFGDSYEVMVSDAGVFLLENGVATDSLAPLSAIYEYFQNNDLASDTIETIQLEGLVFHDEDENCAWNNSESGIYNYQIKIKNLTSGTTAFTTSDSIGAYQFEFCANGDSIEISGFNPYLLNGNCTSPITIVLLPGTNNMTVDIPVQISCSQLLVDIGTWSLRRCFENKYYVTYQNLSPITQEDVYVDVQLDPFMTFIESNNPSTDLGDNLYRFELGDLAALSTGSFWIKFDLSCDAVLGQTHCVSAEILPETMCDTTDLSDWSGASIAISGECLGDSLNIKIENVGAENMPTSKNYIIVEDVIMLSIDPFQLDVGEVLSFNLPANGQTWHVSAEQVDFHPGESQPSITVEGCNGNNIPGLALSFPQNDADPNIAIDCRINTGSFDPNDKQAAPRGIGAEREIAANVGMEYMIRFQNTGTDTAFTVVVEDEISELLNTNSIIPGASSHPYAFEKVNNTIRFTFDHIMLPDSTADLEGSQGFVKFNILQQPDNAPGAIINNQAAIYFDFNEPIITNDAFVKISDHPFGVINYIPEINSSRLSFFPNPTNQYSTLIYNSENFQAGQLNIYNINGQLLRSTTIASPETRLDFAGWPKGIYPMEFIIDDKKVETGKLVIQ